MSKQAIPGTGHSIGVEPATTDAKQSERSLVLAMIPWLKSAANLAYIDEEANEFLIEAGAAPFPHNACAATQSAILIEAGLMDLDDPSKPMKPILGALALDNYLHNKRGWTRVPLGEQQVGDIGTTCGTSPHAGRDHVFMWWKINNTHEGLVIDNQSTKGPHVRRTDGQDGKSRTTYSLRAPE
jgi:hypothetical protein